MSINYKHIGLLYILLSPLCVLQAHSKKKYTLLVFMAADNNLARYALYNVEQMLAAGSNQNINILVQINTPGKQKKTERYFIEKGKKILITARNQAPTEKLNSGNPQTLIDAADWAIKNYPAENLILNLWSHGSGIYDPSRSYGEFDLQFMDDLEQRGICFDDTFKSYMTNKDIKFALQEIQQKTLGGKKIAVLWLEACLMSMVEVASSFKDHVDYLVSSQNVEYAPGSSYPIVLNKFHQEKIPTPAELACHIVESFKKVYGPTALNYTQSAINLAKVGAIETNINLIALQLLAAIESQNKKSVTTLLKKCKSTPLCTCFHEPSFIDLKNFYSNLQINLNQINLKNKTKENSIKSALLTLTKQGLQLINDAVIANAAGNNTQQAQGLSIHFPEHGTFPSYLTCHFNQSNSWGKMLIQYILKNKS